MLCKDLKKLLGQPNILLKKQGCASFHGSPSSAAAPLTCAILLTQHASRLEAFTEHLPGVLGVGKKHRTTWQGVALRLSV